MSSINFVLIIFIILALNGCSSCSRSGRRNINKEDQSNNVPITKNQPIETEKDKDKCIVSMTKVNNVYEIPIEIDDIPMHFIFDTGASMISISETETSFLIKQGKLSQDDFKGKADFMDANGDISEGTIINLRSVKICDRSLYNVEASVVHNLKAPLLLGQSALEKFGRISIDYNHNELIFE